MTRALILVIMSLGASSVGLALDPTINKVTAEELVRDALASLGEHGTDVKIEVEPWPYYWAPDFITLQAYRPHPTAGTMETWYFAVNPWTGDVWDPFGCTRLTSPAIKRKQEAIWKSSKLPDEARQFLQARTPACTPPGPERSPEHK
jgi:hypothetical protein